MYGCKDNIDIVKETKYLYDNNRTTNGIITDYQFAKSTEWKSYEKNNQQFVEMVMEIDLPKVFNYLEAENWQASNTFSEMSEHLRRSKIKENSPMDKELDYISHNYSKLKNAFNISKNK